MPQEFVYVAEVHVVVVHLVVALRIAADVAVAVHLGAPFLLGPRHVLFRILGGMRIYGGDTVYLRLGVGVEMRAGAVVPAQEVAAVGSAPTA